MNGNTVKYVKYAKHLIRKLNLIYRNDKLFYHNSYGSEICIDNERDAFELFENYLKRANKKRMKKNKGNDEDNQISLFPVDQINWKKLLSRVKKLAYASIDMRIGFMPRQIDFHTPIGLLTLEEMLIKSSSENEDDLNESAWREVVSCKFQGNKTKADASLLPKVKYKKYSIWYNDEYCHSIPEQSIYKEFMERLCTQDDNESFQMPDPSANNIYVIANLIKLHQMLAMCMTSHLCSQNRKIFWVHDVNDDSNIFFEWLQLILGHSSCARLSIQELFSEEISPKIENTLATVCEISKINDKTRTYNVERYMIENIFTDIKGKSNYAFHNRSTLILFSRGNLTGELFDFFGNYIKYIIPIKINSSNLPNSRIESYISELFAKDAREFQMFQSFAFAPWMYRTPNESKKMNQFTRKEETVSKFLKRLKDYSFVAYDDWFAYLCDCTMGNEENHIENSSELDSRHLEIIKKFINEVCEIGNYSVDNTHIYPNYVIYYNKIPSSDRPSKKPVGKGDLVKYMNELGYEYLGSGADHKPAKYLGIKLKDGK